MKQMKLLRSWGGMSKGTIIEAGPARFAKLSGIGVAVEIVDQEPLAADEPEVKVPLIAVPSKKSKGKKS